jgi:hypothetical protein
VRTVKDIFSKMGRQPVTCPPPPELATTILHTFSTHTAFSLISATVAPCVRPVQALYYTPYPLDTPRVTTYHCTPLHYGTPPHIVVPHHRRAISNTSTYYRSKLRGGGCTTQHTAALENTVPSTQYSQCTPHIPSEEHIVHDHGPTTIIEYYSTRLTHWAPETELPYKRSNHPLDTPWLPSDMNIIVTYSRLPPNLTIAYITANPRINITVQDLQNLVDTNAMTNDDTMAMFLETFCTSTGHAYLCPQFLPLLRSDGWPHIQNFFTCSRHLTRTVSRPNLVSEPAIAIPCFVNHNHWVAWLGEKLMGKFTFYMLMTLIGRQPPLWFGN